MSRLRINDNLFEHEKKSISHRKTIEKIMNKMKELKDK